MTAAILSAVCVNKRAHRMIDIIRALLILSLGLMWHAGALETSASDQLPLPVQRILSRYSMTTDGLSIFAQEIGASTPILAIAADTPRNPASTMKLLATLVALDELGPAYTWKTEAYTVGSIKQGRLDGDLYLKGYGDPYLITESFWQLLHGLRQRGLTHIAGDLVLDSSYLQPAEETSGDFDGQKFRAYNAQPAALLINFQAINFRFLPDPASRSLRIIADPHPDTLIVENKVNMVNEPCRGWANRLGMQVSHTVLQDTVRFTGSYAANCGEHDRFHILTDAPRHVYGVFKALWAEQGGRLDGVLREAVLPGKAQRLDAVESKPLAEILRGINKYSNNVMTRQLVLTLGAERIGPPGTTEKGLQVIRTWLQQHQLNFPELVLENGVGLSREERISARHLGELLFTGYNSRYMPEFVSSLPIAATDGTLQKRFVDSELAGRLHAKTGGLKDVKSIAGYLLDQHGRRVVVVCLHNHPAADTRAGEQVQDALLKWLYERP